MQIINVVELLGGVLSNITPFVITSEATREETVEAAENFFKKLVLEYNEDTTEEELEEYLEDGFVSDSDQDILIHWSETSSTVPKTYFFLAEGTHTTYIPGVNTPSETIVNTSDIVESDKSPSDTYYWILELLQKCSKENQDGITDWKLITFNEVT